MERLVLVAGARPNFMKIMPICRELERQNREYVIFNSCQHYDNSLNSIFIEEFNLGNKIVWQEVDKTNKVRQMQDIMYKFRQFLKSRDDISIVVVVGDVDTSYCCAITSSRRGVPIAHIESGLRSFDISMPEEKNRITIDQLSTFNFAHSIDAIINLRNEGIINNVYHVGNIMIDTLEILMDRIKAREPIYNTDIIVTLHRPENVDNIEKMLNILKELYILSSKYSILFPVHPRTFNRWPELFRNKEKLRFVEPMGYMEFMSEIINCKAVITDSGGIQEETSYLGIPCFTVRQSTERPITIELGTNKLISVEEISSLEIPPSWYTTIPLWDGRTAERICDIL